MFVYYSLIFRLPAKADHRDAVRNLEDLVAVARARFPSIRVLIHEINVSPCPSRDDGNTIKEINRSMEILGVEVVRALPQKDFRMEVDGMHWTERTANTLLRSTLAVPCANSLNCVLYSPIQTCEIHSMDFDHG